MTGQVSFRHLCALDELSQADFFCILDTAQSFIDDKGAIAPRDLLSGKLVANAFFEPSTRTLLTFETAARNCHANVMNFTASTSSLSKGESLLDTVANLQAMQVDIIVMRHPHSGAAQFVSKHVQPNVGVVNAGDGCYAHPTQALLDALTIRQCKPNTETLTVAIVGDILHSRVARSQIHALHRLGVHDIRVIAPKTLLPADTDVLGVHVTHDIESGLEGADVVIGLRLQRERMLRSALIPSSSEYMARYGITMERLARAKPDAIVMHPGPINHEVEMAHEVVDCPQSVILQQVRNGLAIRMAVLSLIGRANDSR